jgi:DNA-binding CsgD family transcriptional regulator
MSMVIDIDFLLSRCPIGLIVVNQKTDIVYSNRQAEIFLKRYRLPPEIESLSRRIFFAIDGGNLSEAFPGEIYITHKFDGSPSNWIFRMYICEKPCPLVYVLIIEEKMSNKLEMNGIRQQFRLTRRETDILRRVVDGLINTEIAEELQMSEQTVKDHLTNIYRKIGAENRMSLIRNLMQISSQ